MLQLSSLHFDRKTPFLKHKNVNLKNLAEVKVVCTDFRRTKSINTTHLRQDIITTIFEYIEGSSGRAVKSPSNMYCTRNAIHYSWEEIGY